MKRNKNKYVVFSFDDGLIDFKLHALPILIKYNFKNTINIISGYSDKTSIISNNYLPIEDIIYLHKKGFEIANHTNSHCRGGSYIEMEECNNKINSWISSNTTLGIVMPKYVKPSKDALKYIKKETPPYVTYSHKEPIYKNFLKRLRLKSIMAIRKDELGSLNYKVATFTYKKGSKLFNRVEVGHMVDPNNLYEALKVIKRGYCITLCFHSITNEYNSCDYPKGAYTIDQFDKLCSLISSNNSFKVITQIEASRR